MHNLSGVFLEEKGISNVEGKDFFTFGIVYPNKTRIYYCEKEQDYKGWISSIKKAIGYSNLTDDYEIKSKLGNGKFGLVKLGIHKKTGRKVAIKIIAIVIKSSAFCILIVILNLKKISHRP